MKKIKGIAVDNNGCDGTKKKFWGDDGICSVKHIDGHCYRVPCAAPYFKDYQFI